eukprot:3306659-Lingulodinium_polyedra.AAC.1
MSWLCCAQPVESANVAACGAAHRRARPGRCWYRREISIMPARPWSAWNVTYREVRVGSNVKGCSGVASR